MIEKIFFSGEAVLYRDDRTELRMANYNFVKSVQYSSPYCVIPIVKSIRPRRIEFVFLSHEWRDILLNSRRFLSMSYVAFFSVQASMIKCDSFFSETLFALE